MKTVTRILLLLTFLVGADKLTSGESEIEKYDRLYHALNEFAKSVQPLMSSMSPSELKEVTDQLEELRRRYLYEETYVQVEGAVMSSRAAQAEFMRLSILKLRSKEQRKLLDQFDVRPASPDTGLSKLRSRGKAGLLLLVDNQSEKSISEIRVEIGWKTKERGTVWSNESNLLHIVCFAESKERKEVISDFFSENDYSDHRDREGHLVFRVVEVVDAEGVSIALDPFFGSDRHRWQVLSLIPENASVSLAPPDR